jgi:transposase
MILKRIEFKKRLNEHQKKLNKHRWINKSWKKKLKKIEISSSRILKKELKMNSFYDEISQKFHEKLINEKSIIEIYLIAIASFNILFR